MQFKNIIAQSGVKAKIIQAAQADRIPHAMMFIGAEGAGSLALALATAQYINCDNPGDTDSCGTCGSCQKNTRMIHPDVHYTYPVIRLKPSPSPSLSYDFIEDWRREVQLNPYLSINDWLQSIKAENKQGNITADECREIIKRINMMPYEGKYKVQIIWLAEYLKGEGNILLKSLEEPPSNTIFILVVEQPDLILNTILSRTQIVRINALEDEDIIQGLTANHEVDEKNATNIARIAEGNWNIALSLSHGETSDLAAEFSNWMRMCSAQTKPTGESSAKLVEWIDDFSKVGRENQKMMFKYGLIFLRECLAIKATGSTQKISGDEMKLATAMAGRLSAEQIENIVLLITNAHYHIERNAHPKILLMSNTLKIAQAIMGEYVPTEPEV